MPRILILTSLLWAFGLVSGDAATLRVLTGAGMAVPVRALAADFARRSGDDVQVISDTAGGVQKRMEGGEHFDLVIATQAVIQALTDKSLVAAEHHDLAQMVAGIAAAKDAPKPVIGTAAELTATLLAARSIAYVDPAMGGITGVFFLAQADRLGIGAAVRTKAVLQPNGTGVADAVAQGRAQYGVTLVSEMLPNPGVTVWPLPDAVQMTTIYAAALARPAENTLDAARLLGDLRGQQGRAAAIAAGLKPLEQ